MTGDKYDKIPPSPSPARVEKARGTERGYSTTLGSSAWSGFCDGQSIHQYIITSLHQSINQSTNQCITETTSESIHNTHIHIRIDSLFIISIMPLCPPTSLPLSLPLFLSLYRPRSNIWSSVTFSNSFYKTGLEPVVFWATCASPSLPLPSPTPSPTPTICPTRPGPY